MGPRLRERAIIDLYGSTESDQDTCHKLELELAKPNHCFEPQLYHFPVSTLSKSRRRECNSVRIRLIAINIGDHDFDSS